LKPEQIRQLLEAGNSETLTEFVGFRCLHNPTGAVASLETYLDHRREGCRPYAAGSSFEEMNRRRPFPDLNPFAGF
jgi:hypothetical protein